MRVYTVLCRTCRGSGMINLPVGDARYTTYTNMEICPVCKGSKVQEVVEYDEPNIKFDFTSDQEVNQ
jgi:DnaJ-class molecular chaperone